MSRRAVFLDRDGVLNRTRMHDGVPHPPGSLTELEILPGVPEALQALRTAGYALIVVTNQPDVARGRCPRQLVEHLHAWLQEQLPLDAIRACFHDDADRCACRKPQPGLLLAAAADLRIDLPSSFMVGDRWRDIEAGRRAGCSTLLVGDGYGEACHGAADHRVSSLPEAAGVILCH